MRVICITEDVSATQTALSDSYKISQILLVIW